MGLFSLFRKDRTIVDDDEEYARPAAGYGIDAVSPDREHGRDPQSDHQHGDQGDDQRDHQRDIARAIVLKIDAIEAAMAADMFDEPAFRRPPRRPPTPATTLPEGPPTELLDEDSPEAEAAPAVEEAAILHANGQADEACRVLAGAVAMRPVAGRTAWWMLLDLYGLLDRQEAFESLAIDYASVFDTTPPAWHPAPPDGEAAGGIVRTVVLPGVLDASATAHMERLTAPAEGIAALRLDVSRITGVEPEGCAMLHDALRQVPPGLPMMLAGIEHLLALARGSVDVGRREDGAAPWLLILALLRLANRAKDFGEAATDYGITFGVAPPVFAPPDNVSCVPGEPAGPGNDRYLLPRQIVGDAADLWAGIRAYAERCPVPVLDGSRLTRIDYAAAGHLLSLLRELADGGRRTELRELNHMVAALLELLGYGGVVRLLPRRC